MAAGGFLALTALIIFSFIVHRRRGRFSYSNWYNWTFRYQMDQDGGRWMKIQIFICIMGSHGVVLLILKRAQNRKRITIFVAAVWRHLHPPVSRLGDIQSGGNGRRYCSAQFTTTKLAPPVIHRIIQCNRWTGTEKCYNTSKINPNDLKTTKKAGNNT